MLDTSNWKEFRIGEHFDIFHGKRLTKLDRIPGDLPLLTAGENNQGVAEYIGNDWPSYNNPISIDMFGNCFYHDGLYTGDDNIYFFINDEISAKSKLFIAAVISSMLKGKFSYGKQFRQGNADNLVVLLPATPSGEPDWGFMEQYIAELEEERVAELEAYLVSTGLDDYELTEEDKETLSLSLKNPHLTKMDIRKILMGFGGKSLG